MTDSPLLTGTPADCPYYRGVGTCDEGLALSCGFYGEPRCITGEPAGGWVVTQPAQQGDADGQ